MPPSLPLDVILLAAGYATRLHPLTLTRPKPLLPVAGRPMLEHILDKLLPIPGLRRIHIVTNARFAAQFQSWAEVCAATHPKAPPLDVLNDGTTDDANKLGAIGDIHFVLRTRKLAHDLLVVAGDNLFSASLAGFAEFARAKNAPTVGVYDVASLEEVKKYNSIRLDAGDRVTFFEEKPAAPQSSLTAIALYFYPSATLPLLHQYIAEGNNPDQPGRLVQWLYPRQPVFAWRVPGLWFDIGSKEALAEADRVFSTASLPAAWP